MPRPRAPKKTVIIHIRVEEDLAEALQRLAEADERKLSPYVARVLRGHVAAQEGEPEGKKRLK